MQQNSRIEKTENVSALVVSFNDCRLLEKSLQSLGNCDELLVFDMGSKDGSLEIARQYASEVRQIPQVDIVEQVWGQVVPEAKNDWIILIDPDEIFPTEIFPALDQLIQSQPDVALVSIPWQYYFLGKELHSTTWGRKHYKARIFNRQHVELTGVIFDGIKLKPGYTHFTFPYESGYILQHYWINSIQQLFSKHWRYIKNDGRARYDKGSRYTFKKQANDVISSLRKNLVDYDGLHDGWRGIFLSFFHAWFIFMCHCSLCYYQYFKAPKGQ